MLKKLYKFVALDSQQKSVFIQAWFMLGWFRVAILSTSFKRLANSLQHHRLPPDSKTINCEKITEATSIGKLVATAARYTPWQSRCLVQVLVVQRLLARQHIPGQFYLGVRKGCEDKLEPAELSAHAWLQCGSVIVNGARGCERFTVVSTFSWGDGCD